MLAVSWYMLVFRLLHIAMGVAWVGSVFLLVLFIQPSAAAIAPAGAPFMMELLGKRRLVDRIIGLGSGTVVAGVFLWVRDASDYGGLGDFITSSFGAWLTIGAVAAIAALAVGVAGTRPTVARMIELMREVAASGGPPAPEQAAELGALQARGRLLAKISLVLLAVAVFAMATARYW